jgi:hypothetical protein
MKRKIIYIVCSVIILFSNISCDQNKNSQQPTPLPYIQLVAGKDPNGNVFATSNAITLKSLGCSEVPFAFQLEVVSPQNFQALEITRNYTTNLDGTQELLYFATSGYTITPYLNTALIGGSLVTTAGTTIIAPFGQQFSSNYLTTSTGFTFTTRDNQLYGGNSGGTEKYTFTVTDQYGRTASNYLTINYPVLFGSCRRASPNQ